MNETAGARERQRTAAINVAAAVVLIAIKLVTGLVTGSLAFIAEAAHSATDLVAALLTLFAVRVAVRPPDREHHYGHGKAEHLGALGESAFLMLVSLFIAFESIRRLTGDGGHHVDVTWWAFAVLGVVIVLDASRAITSFRASQRTGSAALGANALHFASDLAGSLAVLIGLLFVRAGHQDADAIAALFVAVLVVLAALRLATRSVDVLMDRAVADADDRIRAALAQADEDVEVRRVRVRQAGGRSFVDLVVGVPMDTGVRQAHSVADSIEEVVERALGGADVVVHVEPSEAEGGIRERATAAAGAIPEVREVHNVRVMRLPDGYELSLHVKLPRELSLDEAHGVVERLEDRVRAEVPELRTVHTHIEPLSRTDWASTPPTEATATEREAIASAVKRFTGADPLDVTFRDGEQGRVALVTVSLPGEQPLPSAHKHAGAIEEAVRERCPDLADVIVHTEPMGAEAT
ncbi:MAG TPA: cation diffusion facilitator family transporter [Thermoleophilaceae bacterium]|nr:cation diffusion facilitator family transporter [Thermoleophilaceae bacterium]